MKLFLQTTLVIASIGLMQFAKSEPGPNWTISARTAYPALEQAEVQLRFGDEVHLAQTDNMGHFTLVVPVPDPSVLISLEVHGQGEQQGLSHARLIGSVEDLDRIAGPGGSIALGPVSPVSSVLYALAEHAAGGHLPVYYEQIVPALRVVNVASFRDMLRAHIAVTAGLVDLPDGGVHALDMLRNPALVLDRLEALTEFSTPWYQASQIMGIMDSDLSLRRTLRRFPHLDIQLATGDFHLDNSGRLRLDDHKGTGRLMTRSYDGPVTVSGLVDPDLIWVDRFMFSATTHPGELIIQPAPGTELLMQEGFTLFSGNPDPVRHRRVLDLKRWRVLDASESLLLVSAMSRVTVYYPENPELDSVTFHYNSPFDVRLQMSNSSAPLSWQGLGVDTQWLLPICVFPLEVGEGPAWQGGLGHDVLSFVTQDTAVAARSGLSFEWSLDDGTLVLSSPELPETVLKLHGEDAWAGNVIASCIEQDSATERTLVAQVTPILDEAPSLEIPGRYISGRNLYSFLPRLTMGLSYPPQTLHWVMDLDADGGGRAGYVDALDSVNALGWYDVEWTVSDTGLIEIHLDPAGFSARPESRSWQLLRRQGDDFIMLEVVVRAERDDLEDELVGPGRFTWFRRTEIPPG